MSSLNPVYTIGDQISEAIELHQKGSKNEIKNKIIKLLRETRIPSPDKMMSSYPHEFSGGMRQRAMIAMMLSCNPRLLIADEPTTSLDVTVQAQILELIKDLRKNYDSSILYITHNLAITAELAERIAVMYAGKIIECADTLTIFKNPMHPYTRALLNSIPKIGKKREEKLEVIPGSVPSLIDNPPGCIFSSRCRYVKDVCRKKSPELIDVEPGHKSACIRAFEI
jgi:peptide/nickel transport system ATP-binding protein